MNKNHLFLIKLFGVVIVIGIALVLIGKMDTSPEPTGMWRWDGECVYGIRLGLGWQSTVQAECRKTEYGGCAEFRIIDGIKKELKRNTCKKFYSENEDGEKNGNGINELGDGKNAINIECIYYVPVEITTRNGIIGPGYRTGRIVYHYNGELDLSSATTHFKADLDRKGVPYGWVICYGILENRAAICRDFGGWDDGFLDESRRYQNINDYIRMLADQFIYRFFMAGFVDEGKIGFGPNNWNYYNEDMYEYWKKILRENQYELGQIFRLSGRGYPNDEMDGQRYWKLLKESGRYQLLAAMAMRWAYEKALENCYYPDEQQQFGIGDVGNFLLNLLFSRTGVGV